MFTMMIILGAFVASPDLYVATDGNDANSGSREAPFATMVRARDAIREIKRTGALPEGGTTVWLHEGDRAELRATRGCGGIQDAAWVQSNTL